jgi:formate-nitrite transporter family protein
VPVGAPAHGSAEVAGAVAFSFGVVFLIVGRTELFSEDFFDPCFDP